VYLKGKEKTKRRIKLSNGDDFSIAHHFENFVNDEPSVHCPSCTGSSESQINGQFASIDGGIPTSDSTRHRVRMCWEEEAELGGKEIGISHVSIVVRASMTISPETKVPHQTLKP
jgi:hypothetical protein